MSHVLKIEHKGFDISIFRDEFSECPLLWSEHFQKATNQDGSLDIDEETKVFVILFENGDYKILEDSEERKKYYGIESIYEFQSIPPKEETWDGCKNDLEAFKKHLEHILKSYTNWASGEFYGYEIRRGDIDIDSCWGLETLDYTIEAAKEVIENMSEEDLLELDFPRKSVLR